MARSILHRFRLLILASPLLVLPIWDHAMRSADIEGHEPTRGVVVGHVKVEPRSGFPRFASVVEYAGPDGRKMQMIDQVERRPAEAVGTAVDVLVDRSGRSAVRAGANGYWFASTVTTALSLAFFALAAAVTFFEFRAERARLTRRKRQEVDASPERAGSKRHAPEPGGVSGTQR